MQSVIAVVLVMVALGATEPPSYRGAERQSAPYNPRGWRPQGAQFNLPRRSQPQQAYGAPEPKPSYGPPPQEPTTTEEAAEISTDPPQTGRFSSKERISAKTSDVVKQSRESYFVVLPQGALVLEQPQSQKLVYTLAQVEKSSPLVAAPRARILTSPLTLPQLLPAVYSSYIDNAPSAGFLVSP